MSAALGPLSASTCQHRERWPFFRRGLSPQAWRAERRHPKSRAGSSSTARTSASSASKVMPISRNGSVKSQTTGKRISASRAKGQQSTNRMHQPTKRIRAFTSLSFHHVASRQRHAVIMSFWLGKLAIPLRELPYKSVGGCSGWGVSSEGADWPGGGFSGGGRNASSAQPLFSSAEPHRSRAITTVRRDPT